jgi:hypothetical protein
MTTVGLTRPNRHDLQQQQQQQKRPQPQPQRRRRATWVSLTASVERKVLSRHLSDPRDLLADDCHTSWQINATGTTRTSQMAATSLTFDTQTFFDFDFAFAFELRVTVTLFTRHSEVPNHATHTARKTRWFSSLVFITNHHFGVFLNTHGRTRLFENACFTASNARSVMATFSKLAVEAKWNRMSEACSVVTGPR